MSRPFRIAVLAAALAASACQDPAETGAAFEPTPVEAPPSRSPTPVPPASAPVVPRGGSPDAPDAVPEDEVAAALPSAPGQDLPGFTTEASSASVDTFGEAVPVLRAVRVGRHDGFDRLVFEFDSDGLPQWHVAYLEGPATDCGSGADVPLAGSARLQVRFSGAHAHTEAGRPTSGPRRRRVDQPALRELVRTCDFEAEVTWVAGVAGRNAYRPRVLENPARLVLDIAH